MTINAFTVEPRSDGRTYIHTTDDEGAMFSLSTFPSGNIVICAELVILEPDEIDELITLLQDHRKRFS